MSKTIPTPQFQHDCTTCTFVGHRDGYDIYVCDQGGVKPTVIARYGNDGPDYTSGASFVTEVPRGTFPCWNEVAAAVLAEYAIQQITGGEAGGLRPIPEYGDLMTIAEFREGVETGMLTEDDGTWVWATETECEQSGSDAPLSPLWPPEWATHVVWFNK